MGGLNIFNLAEEFKYLLEDIEAAEGEISPELKERLVINEDDTQAKFNAYASIINMKNGENAIIATEIERLQALTKSNERIIEKLKEVLKSVLPIFGELGKTGNYKYATTLHKFWNVYTKPVVIDDEELLPKQIILDGEIPETVTLVDFTISTKVNADQLTKIKEFMKTLDLLELKS
jgi:hypothetical protein